MDFRYVKSNSCRLALLEFEGEKAQWKQTGVDKAPVYYCPDLVAIDGYGNRTGFYSSIPGVSSPSTTYDANDRATNCTWDNAGNMLADAAGNTYEYDPKNRLTKATKSNGDIVTYTYDYTGNLIAKAVNGTTTQYNVDVNNPTGYAQVFEEVQGSEATVRYTYCTSLLSQSRNTNSTWTTNYYLQDGHGNVRLMADESGAVTDTVDFDAFGQIINHTGNTPNEFLYCAERKDPNTGLYFLRSRWMDAGSGRFVGMDGFEGDTESPASLHKYLYCASEPVNNVDPSGEFGICDAGAMISMVGILSMMPTTLWGGSSVQVELLPKDTEAGIIQRVMIHENDKVIPDWEMGMKAVLLVVWNRVNGGSKDFNGLGTLDKVLSDERNGKQFADYPYSESLFSEDLRLARIPRMVSYLNYIKASEKIALENWTNPPSLEELQLTVQPYYFRPDKKHDNNKRLKKAGTIGGNNFYGFKEGK
jgi:RHS repeat-associated protein